MQKSSHTVFSRDLIKREKDTDKTVLRFLEPMEEETMFLHCYQWVFNSLNYTLVTIDSYYGR